MTDKYQHLIFYKSPPNLRKQAVFITMIILSLSIHIYIYIERESIYITTYICYILYIYL